MGNEIGKDHIRKDSRLKVTGKAEFVADIHLPDMLECRILKSPYAHAKIIEIDTSEAEKLPGVRAILTNRDKEILLPIPLKTGMRDDFYAMPSEKVYMAGEQVAAVAAETREIASEAIELIKVEYEPLPAVFDPLDALAPDAPLLYDDLKDNRMPPVFPPTPDKGDVEKAFEEADIILESLYHWPTPAHCPLETYQAIAKWNGDRLTVWITTQSLWEVQDYLSQALGIPADNIDIICKWVGGAFGAKYGASHVMLASVVAALSKKTGRPVRSLLEMDEQFIISHHACGPGYYRTKGGIKREDGRPIVRETELHVSLGGHGVHAPVAFCVTGESATNVYNYDSHRVSSNPVFCNLNLSGPKRSYGDAEGFFCSEQFADEMAEAAGIDPVEWRKKWCNKPGDPLSSFFGAGELAGGDYVTLMAKAADAFGWKEKWKGWKIPTEINGARRRGVGMSLSMHVTGFGSSRTLVRINKDGTIYVNCTAEDIGQGIKSATAICVAEILGVAYEDVTVSDDDTRLNPRGGGVFGSKGTPTNIGGTIAAARNARKILLERAADIMEVPAEDLDIKEGRIFSIKDDSRSSTIGEVANASGYENSDMCAYGETVTDSINPETGRNRAEKSLAALFCEVEVDTETGAVHVLKIVMASDGGIIINPTVAMGQCYGGIIQGLGFALYEDIIFDKANQGIVLNPNMTDYRIPTFLELHDFKAILHSDPADAPTAAMNAKGMGEATIVPVAPAIANAVYNATGTRMRSGPFTPDNVLNALKNCEAGQS